MTDILLASLLCSRICHDLVSPVGAINNGLEIMDDDADESMREVALDLIRTSSKQASAKLQFMRIAFGAAGGVEGQIPMTDAVTLTEALVASGEGIELSWHGNKDMMLEKAELRLCLNLILIAYEGMPRGGKLSVGARKEGATNFMVSAKGPYAKAPPEIMDVLMNGADVKTLNARYSGAYLSHLTAKELGGNIYARQGDELIELAVTM